MKATDASLWSVVRRKLRVIVHRTVNTKKFSTELGSAICVFVHVSGEKYGFCTYIFLLIPDEDSIWHAFDQISAEEKAKLRAQKKMSMKLARKIIWGHENEEKRKEKGISQRVSGRSYSQYDRYWVKYLKELRRKIEEEKRIEEKRKQEEARRQAEAEEEDGKGKSRFIVVHLDFFKMRCDASEASSLCSEYCCDSQRWDTIFCNSKVKCY